MLDLNLGLIPVLTLTLKQDPGFLEKGSLAGCDTQTFFVPYK